MLKIFSEYLGIFTALGIGIPTVVTAIIWATTRVRERYCSIQIKHQRLEPPKTRYFNALVAAKTPEDVRNKKFQRGQFYIINTGKDKYLDRYEIFNKEDVQLDKKGIEKNITNSESELPCQFEIPSGIEGGYKEVSIKLYIRGWTKPKKFKISIVP
ncbi:MAG: hypothetical protein IPP74_04685 [Alphaproteobacteria bacterium]|nr:hypothetical protein [Alphaproteobacteria bacterium]